MTEPNNIYCKKCRYWMRTELAIKTEDGYVCKECLDKKRILEEKKQHSLMAEQEPHELQEGGSIPPAAIK